MKLHLSILVIVLISISSCRKFTWDNSNDTTNPSTQPVNLKNGLVAYYPFNGNANDESGNGNTGLVVGAKLSEDRFGNILGSYKFNGLNNFIDIGSGGLSSNPNDYSFSAWVYFDSIYRADFGSGGAILTKRQKDLGTSWSSLTIDNAGFANFVVDGPGYFNALTGGTSLLNKKWNNIIGIKSGVNYSIYLNGLLIANKLDGYIHFGSTNNMYIGKHGAWNLFFYGSIDDVRIYNRALTQEEITYLANN
jgi:hypothetical protein